MSVVTSGAYASKMKLPAASLPTDRIPHLLKPVKLGELVRDQGRQGTRWKGAVFCKTHLYAPPAMQELRNRFVLASMTRGRSGFERVANDANAAYYADRAMYAGGFRAHISVRVLNCHLPLVTGVRHLVFVKLVRHTRCSRHDQQ